MASVNCNRCDWHEKDKTKIARKEKRQRKKRKIEKNMQTEGITYEAGAF